MGGGFYDRDVESTSSSSWYSETADTQFSNRDQVDPALLRNNMELFCDKKNPIVCAIDVTGSMGNWAKILWDKMPMFYGQLLMQGYLPEPSISFAAIGDANSDTAPMQICEFAQGSDLDNWLNKIWLEGGGGGQAKESYELIAYYYARKCRLQNSQQSFFFFTGDEGFYPNVESNHITSLIEPQEESIPSKIIFDELKSKFNVFLVHKNYGKYTGVGSENERIVRQWEDILGTENIISLEDPKAVVDIILGTIALASGTRKIDNYLVDMQERGQTSERLKLVENSLKNITDSTSLVRVETNNSLNLISKLSRKEGSKRL